MGQRLRLLQIRQEYVKSEITAMNEQPTAEMELSQEFDSAREADMRGSCSQSDSRICHRSNRLKQFELRLMNWALWNYSIDCI